MRRDQIVELADFQYRFDRVDVICNHVARLVGASVRICLL
jgi:hypothetical protein